MGLQLKKGDRVRVRTGKDKGRVERILEVLRGKDGLVNKVLVEHVNTVKRHTRASANQPGGIIEKESPIHASNVMLVDPKSDQATRYRAGQDDSGAKIRVSVKSNSPV